MIVNNPGAPQFASYSYGPTSLGIGATYVPAANTIVMSSYLQANQDLAIRYGASDLKSVGEMGANSRGWIGCTFCDGTNIGFYNSNIAAKNLTLYGVTMS